MLFDASTKFESKYGFPTAEDRLRYQMLTDNNSVNAPLIGKIAASLIDSITSVNLTANKSELVEKIEEIQKESEELNEAIGPLVDHER